MARKPDKLAILAGDAYLADVLVGNLNVEVTRTEQGVSVKIRDIGDPTRKTQVHMTYDDHPSFKVNDVDIGEWMKWMEETQNFKTLANMLAWIKFHEDTPRKATENEGGPFPRAEAREQIAAIGRDYADAELALKRAAYDPFVAMARDKLPPGGPVTLRADVKVDFPVTADTFYIITGHRPVYDDLERCNCTKAGEVEHWSCGMCRHGQPVFMCPDCFSFSPNLEGRQRILR